MISLYGKQYEWFQRKVKKSHLIRQGCIVSFLGNYTKQDNKLVALYLYFDGRNPVLCIHVFTVYEY